MTILVTGATGNVGRHVVAALARTGHDLRALTRNPAAAEFPPGVQVVAGDLGRADTLTAALAGVERLFLFPLAYLRPVVESYADVTDTSAVVHAARQAGVRRIVLLSSSDDGFRELEQVVEATGLEWTCLRPGEFMLNRIDMWAPSIRTEGVVRSAHPDARGVPIHEADIAAVAVAALLGDGHVGATYELTGPEALTLREQVDAIAAGLGRDLRFEELTPEQAREDLLRQGIPADVVEEFAGGLARQVGTDPAVLPTVEQVTGRPARTLRQWAADHAADFR
jgi:uncharacterized protein YbjT (DUF2867 family)